jgi:signal transduction histidine kinase
VPFLFSVAIFYGYLVDRLRKDRRQLSREQAVIEGLERNRRALAEANEELRRLSEVKSKFVSTVSHELKSPLTAIKNAVSLIEPGGDGESNEKFLEMIRRNADRLNIIIADLLDMSKAESGSLTIAADALDLRPFLVKVMEPFETQAEGAGIGISLEIESSGSLPLVLADANRIEQVVANLLSNALKATPKGGSITLTAEDGGDDWITIRVTDDGVGLSAEDRTKVFEPFFQAENTLEGKPAGTGLGLTICRDLIRGHGSELNLESELGSGSSFSFSLPVLSDRARESVAFENQVRTTFRAHPYFAVLIVDGAQGDSSRPLEPALDAVRNRLVEILPRELDVLCEQRAHGRIIVVMLSTPLGGGWVVKRKLASAFAQSSAGENVSREVSFKVLGPAGFPDDGEHGSILIDRALELGEQLEERS